MVMAMIIGLGLGITGGLLLGGQLFKGQGDVDEDRYHYLDLEADNDDNVPEPSSGKDISPEFREILKYAPKWTTWPDFEQVRWLNSTIEWLWPNLTRGVCKMVTDMVKPMLEDVVAQQPMIDEVVIEELDLGANPMRLAGLKVYDTKDDEVILEAPVQWGSTCKIHVLARVRLGPASIVVPVKVDNVQVSATARITIRPLVDTLPCLGAIAISLTESPFVDLSLKAVTGMDLLAIPFVHEAMTMGIKMATEKICVYPNQIPIPLMENSGLPSPPVGMFELTVQRAGNLRSKDVVGAGDPYVRISVLTMGTAKDKHGKEVEIVAKEEPPHVTDVKHKKNPEYNEHFKILVPALSPKHVLAFRLFDKDMLGVDEVMGEYDIILDPKSDEHDNDFLKTCEETQLTLNLLPEKGTQERMKGVAAGELYIMVQYTPFFNAIGNDDADDDDPGKAMEQLNNARKVRAIDDSSKGVLTVEIYRAIDLPLNGKSCDSYVEMRLSDPENPDGPDVRVTPTVLNERSPRYRATKDFVYVSATSTLTLTVYDHPDKLELGNIVRLGRKSDTVIGKVRMHVRDVAKTGRVKDQFPLQEADQGDLHMQLVWTPVEKDD